MLSLHNVIAESVSIFLVGIQMTLLTQESNVTFTNKNFKEFTRRDIKNQLPDYFAKNVEQVLVLIKIHSGQIL